MGNDQEREGLDDLSARIRAAGKKPGDTHESIEGEVAGDTSDAARAGRVGYEFVGTILGCMLIGWLLDRWVGTSPWGILVMLAIGFGVGMFNVWRALNGYDQSVGLHKRHEK
ncbi:MAG: AtpZ/AtpI family protein [Alphaproteobacteria bacterium]|nr:AtpZ/AtpI family protein [Alphaproteobacteria bacterium]